MTTPPLKVLTHLDITEERAKTGCYAHGDQAVVRVSYRPGMSYLLCQAGVDELFLALSSHISPETYQELREHFMKEDS